MDGQQEQFTESVANNLFQGKEIEELTKQLKELHAKYEASQDQASSQGQLADDNTKLKEELQQVKKESDVKQEETKNKLDELNEQLEKSKADH